MNAIERTIHWGETHHPAWLDPLRMILGVILFIKGIFFIRNTGAMDQMLANTDLEFLSFLMVHYVVFAHLVGGLLIACGLLTRLAVLFQLPILLGAVFFVNAEQGFFSMNSELGLSVFILILLIVFLVVGSGPYSLDSYYRRHRDY